MVTLAERGRAAEAIAAWQRALAGDGESMDRAAIQKRSRLPKRRSDEPCQSA